MAARLTDKRRAFIDAYMSNGFNGTKAALAAGYKESNARSTASDLLSAEIVRAEIDKRMAAAAMNANEVLARLTAMARVDMGAFIGVKERDLKTHPEAFLIKKYKRTEYEDGSIKTELELHDAQAALVQLGRHHRLFTDRVEVDDWRTKAIEMIRRGEIDFEALAAEFNDIDLATRLFTEAGIAVSAGAGAE